MSTKTVPEIVTEQVIAGLEAGKIPWEQPWTETGRPKNFASGKAYNGINILLTSMYTTTGGYKYPLFATWKQIETLGGTVLETEKKKSYIVYFLKTIEVEDKNDPEKKKKIWLDRYYRVWNIEQTDIDMTKYIPVVEKLTKGEKSERAETLLNLHSPDIRWGGDRAYYSPREDYIQLPHREAFKGGYYLTAFHELTHWTGNEARLNRFVKDGEIDELFRRGSYSQEELVAEMGACMLGMNCGIVKKVGRNNQAYINGWMDKLKGDPKFIIAASSRAQKAYDWLTREPQAKEVRE